MKKISATIFLLLIAAGVARAADFWEIYAQNLTYNYSIKVGAIPDRVDFGRRLSNDDMLAVMTRSFSQTLGQRVTRVAADRQFVALACMFSSEAQRCVVDNILEFTFNEVHFINAPGFSNKFLKKLQKYYSYSLYNEDEALERQGEAAARVPRFKNFNPRFGFNLNEPEIILSTPFYTFMGIYVEPRYGTRRGPSVSLMYGNYYFDFQREGLAIKRKWKQSAPGRGYLSITVRPEGEFYISNEFMLR